MQSSWKIHEDSENVHPAVGTRSNSIASKLSLRPRTVLGELNGNGFGLQNGPTSARGAEKPTFNLRKERKIEAPEWKDIDAADMNDPLCCAEYVNGIFEYLRRSEDSGRASSSFLSMQSDVNEKMRSILVDWLVDVHLKFKLHQEVLYLTANIIDRFLEKQRVARSSLQLVGVTSLLLACKYEEIYYPDISRLVYICDSAYTAQQIIAMEPVILNALGFRLTIATPATFLKRFVKAAEGDQRFEHLVSYVLEQTLLDVKFLKYAPSMLVASSVSYALSLMGKTTWTPTLLHYTKYAEDDLTSCVADIRAAHRKAGESTTLMAIQNKYSTRYSMVATAYRAM